MTITFFASVCFFVMCAGAVIECIANFLSVAEMRKMTANPPSEFCESSFCTYDFIRAVNYSSDKAYFSLAAALCEPVFWGVMLFGGMLEQIAEIFSAGNSLFGALAVILAVTAARYVICLPCEIISTFYIEKKHGFSTITPKLWLLDEVKKIILSAILVSAISAALLALAKYRPSDCWLYIWLTMMIFSIALTVAMPFVLRLFCKYEPLADPELEERAAEIMRRAGLRLRGITRMDASSRTRHVNAFFFGFGPTKRIMLFDTLADALDRDETVGVIAHEAAHCKHRHILKFFIIQQVLFFIAIYAGFMLVKNSFLLNGILPAMSEKVTDGTYPFYAVSGILCVFLAESLVWMVYPVILAISRRFEYEADRTGAGLCGNGEFLASALIKLCRGNLSAISPHPLSIILKQGHPAVIERIRRLRKTSAE